MVLLRFIGKYMNNKMKLFLFEEWFWVFFNGMYVFNKNYWFFVYIMILGLFGDIDDDEIMIV